MKTYSGEQYKNINLMKQKTKTQKEHKYSHYFI